MTGTYMMCDRATKHGKYPARQPSAPLARWPFWFALGCTVIIAFWYVVGRWV